jgi:asparagine synthase (glutamine-hydrolysing)
LVASRDVDADPDAGGAGVPAGAESFRSLDAALESSMRRWKAGEVPVVVLFSGGVDSGLLAWELRGRSGLSLATAGVAGAPDLVAARESAPLVGAPWHPIAADSEIVHRVRERIGSDLGDLPALTRRILIALAVALDGAPAGEVLCGQGADELFLGYAHFRGLDPARAAARSAADLAALLERDWPRTRRIAETLGRSIQAPYLAPEFVRASQEIPLRARLPDPVPKAYFRAWARHRGLPALLADRPKRALQYGSGIDRVAEERGDPRPRGKARAGPG